MEKHVYRSKLYAPLLLRIRQTYGNETADNVINSADIEYKRMCQLIGRFPKAHKQHVNNVLERAALYSALKMYFPEQAYEMIYEPAHERNVKTNRMIAGMTRRNTGARMFIGLMYKLGDTVFSEKSGHIKEWKIRDKYCAAFDMLACPYVKYCNMAGVPELSKSFCDDDIEVFSNLPNIRYTRPQTLGTGGDKCDFRMELALENKDNR